MGFSGIKAGKLMKKHSNMDFSTLQLSNHTQFISYDINKYIFFKICTFRHTSMVFLLPNA